MKRFLVLSIMIFAVVFSVTAQESSSPTIAIMDVAATNTSEVKSQVIYEYIIDVVNRSGFYTIVERSALQAAIKEMKISSSGMIDDSTAAQIGKLVGAELILVSNLIVDDEITYLSTRIIEVQTGQVRNTAMLQKGYDEYIASLANRTVSQLLGQPEGKPGPPADEVVETETEVVEEKTEVKDEPVKVEEKEGPKTETGPAGTSGGSKLSLTVRAAGVIPVLDDAEIFDIGYGVFADFNYKIMNLGKNSLLAGVGTGLSMDKASSEKGVVFPYNMLGIPLSLNVKYRINMKKLYFTAKIAVGGMVNMFMYTETSPTEEMTVLVSNFAISPGLSVGYNLSEKIGLALFCDWSQTFFKNLAYTALNAGLAVDINL